MGLRIVPIMDRVLIQRDVDKTTKAGIILVADKHATINGKEYNTGTVLAIGETVEHPEIVPGARVYFGKHAGAYIRPDKEAKYNDDNIPPFICAEADIIAILKEEEAHG